MRLTQGFEYADSRNLPHVNILMVLEYILENNSYNATEIGIAKALLRSREIYLDTAVGYVELKREEQICTVKCRLLSEHIIEKKLYIVTAVINESTETVVKIECKECDGCRHAICFALWLIKRSNESPERSISHWTKPIFAEVEKCGFVTAKELGKKRKATESNELEVLPEKDGNVLTSFIEECKRRNIKTGPTLNYFSEDYSNEETSPLSNCELID